MHGPEGHQLSASQEDYLETILALEAEHGSARVRDIAARLGVAMPSVTEALRNLAKRGLVNYSPYEHVTLSEHGRRLATGVRKRHGVLRRFFGEVLGVDDALADANACRIEHAVDDAVLARLTGLMDYLGQPGPRGGDPLSELRQFYSQRADTPTPGRPQ